MKFEVGKKYKNLITETIMEVLYVGKTKAFCVTSDGIERSLPFGSSQDYTRPSEAPWVEYREPVKRWINLYKYESGVMETGMSTYATEEEAIRAAGPTRSGSYLKSIEVEF